MVLDSSHVGSAVYQLPSPLPFNTARPNMLLLFIIAMVGIHHLSISKTRFASLSIVYSVPFRQLVQRNLDKSVRHFPAIQNHLLVSNLVAAPFGDQVDPKNVVDAAGEENADSRRCVC